MTHFLKLFALVLTFGLTAPVQAQTDGPASIEGTIRSQLEAFQADDLATAFGFASTIIQGMFGTPENFGMMVQRGYPMIWRPADVQFLEQHQSDGLTQQDVQFIDQVGRRYVAEYTMIKTPDGWRINAVQIQPAPHVGV